MSDLASLQRDIEEGKEFALSMGMSPEQVATLYDVPDESPPPSPRSTLQHAKKPLGGMMVVGGDLSGREDQAMFTNRQLLLIFLATMVMITASTYLVERYVP